MFSQEVYISKVKALLGKELHLENGNSNGYTNGSHKGEEASMDVQEEEETMKSPTASKGKGGRRSKANSDTKS